MSSFKGLRNVQDSSPSQGRLLNARVRGCWNALISVDVTTQAIVSNLAKSQKTTLPLKQEDRGIHAHACGLDSDQESRSRTFHARLASPCPGASVYRFDPAQTVVGRPVFEKKIRRLRYTRDDIKL